MSAEMKCDNFPVPLQPTRAGEDGNWESVDLNQDFYEEYRAKAPEYVDMQIENFARSQKQVKVDFDHWMVGQRPVAPPPQR